jgi:hypothetical protein
LDKPSDLLPQHFFFRGKLNNHLALLNLNFCRMRKNSFSAFCYHSCESRACLALDAGNPSSLNTGSLLSQGQRLDSRLHGSDAELEFFRILLKLNLHFHY